MAEKKRTEVDWQDVRVFLALGRHGSLSAAARALGVNHATISRRIQSLEATLGEKLAERRPEGYVLTPAGARALSVASDMETAVQTLGRGGTDDAPKGIVRVNAPPALSQAFLTRRLAEVPILFPGLDIDLATDLRSISLERHEADIAVRIDKPEDGDFIAKPVGSIDFGFYGTPAVCERVEGGEAPILVGFRRSEQPYAGCELARPALSAGADRVSRQQPRRAGHRGLRGRRAGDAAALRGAPVARIARLRAEPGAALA